MGFKIIVSFCRHHDYPNLGKGLISWVWKLIRVPESKVVECAGYDAAVYQRLSLLGAQIFVFCCFYGLIVLLPVYITACDGDNCQDGLNLYATVIVDD
jgi:hypothetical protein